MAEMHWRLAAWLSVFAMACAPSRDGSLACDPGETLCNKLCVDIKIDNANCGSCGNQCTGASRCASGLCVDPCAPLSSCSFGCVNLTNDKANCGSCANACPSAQSCLNGTCTCPPSTPDSCGTGAETICVTLSSDVQHCGACDRVCGALHVCSNGNCQLDCQGLTACPSSGAPTYCANLTNDAMNCGACGTVCPANATCNSSNCICPSAVMGRICNNACVDIWSNAGNCGGCAHACAAGIGEQCVLGVCKCPGAQGMTCGGHCTDLATDAANCGGCGNICVANNSCVAGHCACGGSTMLSSCGNICVNLNSDANHCGDCAVACTGGKACFDRACKPSSTQGTIALLAGLASTQVVGYYADGTGAAAKFSNPLSVVADNLGNAYVADTANNVIRKVVIATSVVTTLAGDPTMSGSADGIGPAAHFKGPINITTDNQGNLYVSDHFNHVVRKVVIATAEVTTLAGSAPLSGTNDGVGPAARFLFPRPLVTDGADTLYVADQTAGTIRKIVISTQTVTTLPPTGLNSPEGIAYDGAGNLYLSSYLDHVIRKVRISDGKVTTVAGTVGVSGNTNGMGTAAQFNQLFALAYDGSANLYAADNGNLLIRKIALSDYTVTTVVGGGSGTYGPLPAALSGAVGVTVTPSGGLIIVDGAATNTLTIAYP